MPRLHEREKRSTVAERALRDRLLEWNMQFEDLTDLERIQVLQIVLSGEISQICRFGIRVERHGEGDTPGGLAKE